MLKVENLHAYYGKSHVLHGVAVRRGRGRDRRPAGPQRLRPLHHRQGDHGHGGLHRHGGLERPATSWARKPYEIAHLGIGYVPENRDIFPKLTVHQNLHAGPEERAAGRAAGPSTTCTRCSRA